MWLGLLVLVEVWTTAKVLNTAIPGIKSFVNSCQISKLCSTHYYFASVFSLTCVFCPKVDSLVFIRTMLPTALYTDAFYDSIQYSSHKGRQERNCIFFHQYQIRNYLKNTSKFSSYLIIYKKHKNIGLWIWACTRKHA